MKTFPALAAAAAGIALMTGCSALGAAPAPTVTVTQTPTASAAAAPAESSPSTEALSKTMWDYQQGQVPDAVFYGIVRNGTTTLGQYSDDDLAVMAQTTCAAVANGTTRKDVILKQAGMAAARQDGDLTAEMGKDVGYLIGAGAKNYCPDQLDTLIAIINA